MPNEERIDPAGDAKTKQNNKEKRRSSVPNDTGEGSALAASAVPIYLLTGDVDDIEVDDCCGKKRGFGR